MVDGTVDEYTYSYDRAGNVTNKTNATETDGSLDESYLYNDLNELISTQRSGNAYQSWTLDSLGNWLNFTDGAATDTKTFNAANEETSSTTSVSATSAYDLAGNATTVAEPNNQTTGLTCVYDAWNRLVSASDGTNTITYQYDGTGRLTERIVSVGGTIQTTQLYSYSGRQVVQVYTYNGAYDGTSDTFQGGQQYIYSPLYVDTPIVRDSYDSGGNYVSSARLFYTTDANHNVTAVTDSTGTVQERYSYDAYGNVTVYSATWVSQGHTSSTSINNTRLFAGMDIDPLTGAYYDNARWYNSTNGDFFNRDPIGYSGGINLYEYCRDNPVDHTDFTGKCCGKGNETTIDPNDPNLTSNQTTGLLNYWADMFFLGQPHKCPCSQTQVAADTEGYKQCTDAVRAAYWAAYQQVWQVYNLATQVFDDCIADCDKITQAAFWEPRPAR